MSGKRSVILMLVLALLCANAVAFSEGSSVQGVASMAMINGIVLTGEDGEIYRFVISRQTDNPDAASIGEGRKVSVTYAGEYRDGCEAIAVALLGSPAAYAADGLATPDDGTGLTVTGTIAGLDGTLLSITGSSQETYDFDISGAVIAGDEGAGVGDGALVAYLIDDGGNAMATAVTYMLGGADGLLGSYDPAVINQGTELTSADGVMLDDSATEGLDEVDPLKEDEALLPSSETGEE